MKTKPLLISILIFAAVAGGLVLFRSGLFMKESSSKASSEKALYYCPMHPTYTSDKPGDCPICNMKLVKMENHSDSHTGHEHNSIQPQMSAPVPPQELTVQALVNMKPGEVCLLHKCKMGNCMIAMTPELARLGKCPHCGEDLGITIREAMPEGYGNVRLSPEKVKLIGMKTDRVKRMPMTKSIRTVGRIAYDPELYQAEEEFVQAVQAFKRSETGTIPELKEQAARLVDSSKIKLRLLGLSDSLIEEVAQAGKPDRSLLYSEPGETVWLYAPIYEYEIPLVKVGDQINVEVSAVPGKKFQGVIRSIDSVIDPTTRSVRVRAALDNPDGFLKPEMYVNASLENKLGEVLAVPQEAVFSTGDQNVVFIAKPDGVFEPRTVLTGMKAEGHYEIKSGLAEGETVVTSGNFLIDSESRLKAALQSAAGGGHQHGA